MRSAGHCLNSRKLGHLLFNDLKQWEACCAADGWVIGLLQGLQQLVTADLCNSSMNQVRGMNSLKCVKAEGQVCIGK